MGCMDTEEGWIGLHQASSAVDVPVTTIRDWYRRGVIGATTNGQGQTLVLLSEVMREATGRDPRQRRTHEQRSRTQQEIEAESAGIAARTRAVTELQGIARERLEDRPPD